MRICIHYALFYFRREERDQVVEVKKVHADSTPAGRLRQAAVVIVPEG